MDTDVASKGNRVWRALLIIIAQTLCSSRRTKSVKIGSWRDRQSRLGTPLISGLSCLDSPVKIERSGSDIQPATKPEEASTEGLNRREFRICLVSRRLSPVPTVPTPVY